MGDVGRVEVADGYLRDRGVEEQLVLRKGNLFGFLRREDDAVGTLFQRGFEL